MKYKPSVLLWHNLKLGADWQFLYTPHNALARTIIGFNVGSHVVSVVIYASILL